MTTKLDQIISRIWARKVPFFTVFFLVVLITYGFLVVIDFVPEPVKADNTNELSVPLAEVAEASTTEATKKEVPKVIDPLPTKIIFDSLNNKEVVVNNPTSNTIPDLDKSLLSGAVRHPDSADFSEPGNIFILAHSSYLPNVFNKNFQAFNGIQKLTWGDKIRLQSSDTEYIYFVEKVYEAKASDVVVPYTPGKAQLTLSTCNSFGTKSDRFIVEAKLVSERPL